jgi:hypothetical protein
VKSVILHVVPCLGGKDLNSSADQPRSRVKRARVRLDRPPAIHIAVLPEFTPGVLSELQQMFDQAFPPCPIS